MSNSKHNKISISTDAGLVHNDNEDNFSINGKTRPFEKSTMNICGSLSDDPLLLAVYDGMGGEEKGEVASSIAAESSCSLFDELNKSEVIQYPDIVNVYVDKTNAEICHQLSNTGSSRGGTTFAMVYVKDGIIYPFSLGDSRIYLLVNGELLQISEDHTLAMKKYKANIYTLEEAENSMDSHKLTLFLGVDVDGNGLSAQWYRPFNMPKSGKLLLCSDGLYDMCSKEEITDIMLNSKENTASELVRSAVKKGGTDNITCIVLEIV